MNGIELLIIVRTFNQSIKVIIISAQALSLKGKPVIIELNIFAVVDKPFDLLELEALVEQALA